MNLEINWSQLRGTSAVDCIRMILVVLRKWRFFGSYITEARMKMRNDESLFIALNDQGVHLLTFRQLVSVILLSVLLCSTARSKLYFSLELWFFSIHPLLCWIMPVQRIFIGSHKKYSISSIGFIWGLSQWLHAHNWKSASASSSPWRNCPRKTDFFYAFKKHWTGYFIVILLFVESVLSVAVVFWSFGKLILLNAFILKRFFILRLFKFYETVCFLVKL